MGRQIFHILVAFSLSCCLALASSAAAIAPHRSDYTAAATATITVNAANIMGPVDQRMFGINTAIWDSAFNTDTTRSMFQEMGVQALRFPGGSLSDEYHWSTNTSRNNTWTWATSFDAFASVALTTRAQVYITANYGSGTAQEAGDWVRYSNIAKGYNFKYWEVGNENYGSWEYDTHAATWDPYTYAVSFRDYVTLMKAVDPSIKVGAVVTTGEDSYINNTNHPAVNPRTGKAHNGWTPVMLATLKSLGVTPDFAIYHRYEQAPGKRQPAAAISKELAERCCEPPPAIKRLSRRRRIERRTCRHGTQLGVFKSRQANNQSCEWPFHGRQPGPNSKDGVQGLALVGFAKRPGE